MSAGAPFTRPREGFRMRFGGMKLNETPDAIRPTKYALAVNVRAVGDAPIRTRPGQVQKFPAGNDIITDMRAYLGVLDATGALSEIPRYLAFDISGQVWLDNSVRVGALVSATYQGAALIPFRPAESPTPWMYVANGADYQKFSAPSPANAVVQQKVGIAEPQAAPEAFVSTETVASLQGNPGYTHAGTAGAASPGARLTSATVGLGVLPDP